MKKYASIAYIILWAVLLLITVFNDYSVKVLFFAKSLLFIHIVYILILVPIIAFRYLAIAKKDKQVRVVLKKMALRIILVIIIFSTILIAVLQHNQSEDFNYQWDYSIENSNGIATNAFESDGKIRGLYIYGLGRNTSNRLDPIIKSNVGWVAVYPYMRQESQNSERINLPSNVAQWSRKETLYINEVKKLKEKNLRVMLKPHLWVLDGWRATIDFDTEQKWDTWFEDYRVNMLHYAKLAEVTKTDLLCIGTELESSLRKKNYKWIQLIGEIRRLYSGKLTYASNWDSNTFYDYPEFWNSMDYIGIQAYFPLTKIENPDLNQIKRGWDKHIYNIEELYKYYNKPIIFTEIGYRSDSEATIKPWEWNNLLSPLYRQKSEETQLLAYEAFFQKIWHKEWFSGAFIWQWNRSRDFSICGKPAENCISKWYSSNHKIKHGYKHNTLN